MNKQIIIDGVNVAECRHFGSQENCTICSHNKCEKYPSCDYKQLKRKEQESEKFKQTLLEIKEICKLAPKKTMCNSCLTFGFPPEHELIKLILHKCEV